MLDEAIEYLKQLQLQVQVSQFPHSAFRPHFLYLICSVNSLLVVEITASPHKENKNVLK